MVDTPQTTPDWRQRRRDLAWLLWDLRDRRREANASLPHKHGIMFDAACEGLSRFDRLIEMVRGINV